MSGVLAHKYHHVPLPLILAAIIVLVIIIAFAVIPITTVTETALIPVTGNQNAYTEFLRGEKNLFEIRTIDANSALTAYYHGEKNILSGQEYALLIQRVGEKDY